MRRSILQLGLTSFLLILGFVFAPLKTYALEFIGPNMQVVFIEGLTFKTVPSFETISFSYNSDDLQEIHIDAVKYEEVKLETFNFSSVESTSTTVPDVSNVSLMPSPTEMPQPTLTVSPTPTVTQTPTPTLIITPNPTSQPTPTSTPVPTQTPTPTPVGDDIWDKLAICEAGGNWGIDTGNGYFGGLQFSQGAWESVGGSGNPAHASREEQIEKGKKLQAIRGWGAWGACAKKLNLL